METLLRPHEGPEDVSFPLPCEEDVLPSAFEAAEQRHLPPIHDVVLGFEHCKARRILDAPRHLAQVKTDCLLTQWSAPNNGGETGWMIL